MSWMLLKYSVSEQQQSIKGLCLLYILIIQPRVLLLYLWMLVLSFALFFHLRLYSLLFPQDLPIILQKSNDTNVLYVCLNKINKKINKIKWFFYQTLNSSLIICITSMFVSVGLPGWSYNKHLKVKAISRSYIKILTGCSPFYSIARLIITSLNHKFILQNMKNI